MARPKKQTYKHQITNGFPLDFSGYLENELRLGYDFVPPIYSLGGNEYCILFRRIELGKPQKPDYENQ